MHEKLSLQQQLTSFYLQILFSIRLLESNKEKLLEPKSGEQVVAFVCVVLRKEDFNSQFSLP